MVDFPDELFVLMKRIQVHCFTIRRVKYYVLQF